MPQDLRERLPEEERKTERMTGQGACKGRIAMAYEHEKSGTTILLDIIRNLVILAATGHYVARVWSWNWFAGLAAAVPIYVIMLNLVGFATLPLYLFTPENRMKARILKALKNGDLDKGSELTEEFEDRFNVNIPDRQRGKRRIRP
jgi:hypothetical protein